MNQFLEWDKLEFKKTSGNEKMFCPNCHDRRTNKRDKSLSIVHSKGFGKCHVCEILVFKDKVQKTEKEYKLPSQEWKNYTKLSDAMVKYLEGRKIPQSVAIELGWTEELHWQPAKEAKVTNLVYNFFEGDLIVNKKYRSGDKKFTQSAGGKPILYNINSVIDSEEIYIVEGEMDVAALYAVGIKNAVSVPNGANDNDDYWINSKKYIEDCKSYVIAVDNDEKGLALRDAISQRLGKWKCSFIDWQGKDANDDLISGVLEESVRNKKKFPVTGTSTIDDLYDEVIDLYDNGLPSTVKPKSPDFGDWRDIFSVMRGQLTTITGVPSHGKSNFNDWYVLNLVKDYNMKVSFFSPEHSPMKLYQINIMEKVTGYNFWGKSKGVKVDRMPKSVIDKYKEWANQKIYFTHCPDEDFPTWDWIFEKFKEQIYAFGIDIFVIDAFNKLILPKGNELQAIRVVLTKLTAFAQSNNVHIFLVAHPTKMKKNESGVYPVPTLYDVAGSADFRNMTHNGYTVYRNFENDNGGSDSTTIINTKTKFSFQGKIGESQEFFYNHLNGRYYVDEPNNRCFFDDGLEYKPDPKPVLKTAAQAFEPNEELEDEVPF